MHAFTAHSPGYVAECIANLASADGQVVMREREVTPDEIVEIVWTDTGAQSLG